MKAFITNKKTDYCRLSFCFPFCSKTLGRYKLIKLKNSPKFPEMATVTQTFFNKKLLFYQMGSGIKVTNRETIGSKNSARRSLRLDADTAK